MRTTGYVLSWVALLVGCHHGSAFQQSLIRPRLQLCSTTRLGMAGGFEWEDPREAIDQGVDNPFKNPGLMKAGEDGMKIDPARLLGPRLNGSNLYFVGMMGTGGYNRDRYYFNSNRLSWNASLIILPIVFLDAKGKSTVGDIVARSKFCSRCPSPTVGWHPSHKLFVSQQEWAVTTFWTRT
jgi:hypothetical protein